MVMHKINSFRFNDTKRIGHWTLCGVITNRLGKVVTCKRCLSKLKSKPGRKK
jgi:hypothetical protein